MPTTIGNTYDDKTIESLSENCNILVLDGRNYKCEWNDPDKLRGLNGYNSLSRDVGADLLNGTAGRDKAPCQDSKNHPLGCAGNDFLDRGPCADSFVRGLGFAKINHFTPRNGDIIDLGSALANHISGIDVLSHFLCDSCDAVIPTTKVAVDVNDLRDGITNFVNVCSIVGANRSNLGAPLAEESLLVPLADAPSDPSSTFSAVIDADRSDVLDPSPGSGQQAKPAAN